MGQGQISVGDVLEGKYEVQRVLGRGAMGLVYEAYHRNLKRSLAVKTLRAEFAGQTDLISRFQQEARAASSIGHPGIVQIFDAGCTQDGAHFIVMEKLEGQNLEEFLLENPIVPIEVAGRLMLEALSGLGAAHRQGIVHRDIKPGNIFLQRKNDGRENVKLLDFGISKLIAGSDPLIAGGASSTQFGAVIGTPLYMSPEQARGQEVDKRSDLWSVGCVLYEMLTGQTPFEGEHPALIIASILAGTFAPAESIRPTLPPKLRAVLNKALSHDVDQRFQNAEDFSASLSDALAEKSTSNASGIKPKPSSVTGSSNLAMGTETVTLDSILGTAPTSPAKVGPSATSQTPTPPPPSASSKFKKAALQQSDFAPPGSNQPVARQAPAPAPASSQSASQVPHEASAFAPPQVQQKEERLELATENVKQVDDVRRELEMVQSRTIATGMQSSRGKNAAKNRRYNRKRSKGKGFVVFILLLSGAAGGAAWYRAQKLGYWGLSRPVPAAVTLNFSTTPQGAEIYADGQALASLSFETAPEQMVDIRATKAGFLSVRQLVEADRFDSKSLSYNLKRALSPMPVTAIMPIALSESSLSTAKALELDDYALGLLDLREMLEQTKPKLKASREVFERSLKKKMDKRHLPAVLPISESVVSESKTTVGIASARLAELNDLNLSSSNHLKYLSKISASTVSLQKYLSLKSYERDNFKRGKQLAGSLKSDFAAAAQAEADLESRLAGHLQNLQARELQSIEESDGKHFFWQAHRLLLASENYALKRSGANREEFATALKALTEYASENAEETENLVGAKAFLTSLPALESSAGKERSTWHNQSVALFNNIEVRLPDSRNELLPEKSTKDKLFGFILDEL